MVVGITGGSGFIGMHLIKKLLSNGYEVKVLALEDNPNFPKEVTFIKGDLVKKENLTKFLKEIDVLIHLAGSILPPDNIMMENNVMSTFNLISEALNYPIKHIVFTSSVMEEIRPILSSKIRFSFSSSFIRWLCSSIIFCLLSLLFSPVNNQSMSHPNSINLFNIGVPGSLLS